jgi:hypothetical protein
MNFSTIADAILRTILNLLGSIFKLENLFAIGRLIDWIWHNLANAVFGTLELVAERAWDDKLAEQRSSYDSDPMFALGAFVAEMVRMTVGCGLRATIYPFNYTQAHVRAFLKKTRRPYNTYGEVYAENILPGFKRKTRGWD